MGKRCHGKKGSTIELWNLISRNVAVSQLVENQIRNQSENRGFLPSSARIDRLPEVRLSFAEIPAHGSRLRARSEFPMHDSGEGRTPDDGLVRTISCDWSLFQQFNDLMLAELNCTVG
ncbi:hypothetical protein ATU3C_17790 [Agrobacterium genomosp. 3 str. RTP8]|nr:hypothetical protein [Agrobacterium tomkonis RTP8]